MVQRQESKVDFNIKRFLKATTFCDMPLFFPSFFF